MLGEIVGLLKDFTKFLLRWRDRRLSPIEKEILSAALDNNGQIRRISTADKTWIRIKRVDYLDTIEDPHRRLKALEAWDRLISLNYAHRKCDSLLEITCKGYKVAEGVKKRFPVK
jgi:hypothetical protein